ncbi:hypothetical protein Ddye_022380 [Dipteronia dyeriana]|uniref:CRM domain-containing protein n=1 Tax=Dipteronia dyeriana TaxID=168575 RepID=A0AAD9U4B9_9ROSI|nr:hypothetical protein Ddye_022380 [Dipteronia dyeriana]
MALVPSRQLYPTTSIFDSFQTSFTRLHGTHLQFFRYGHSISLKERFLFRSFSSLELPEQNPPRKLRSMSTSKFVSRHDKNNNVNLSSSSEWLDRWNKKDKLNQPRPPQAAVNYRKNNLDLSTLGFARSSSKDGGSDGVDDGSSTMEKIVKKLKKFGYMDGGGGGDSERREKEPERVIEKGSIEDIFYVEEGMLPNTRGGFSKESPLGLGEVVGSDGEVKFPWEKPKEKEGNGEWSVKTKSRTSLAELTLPEPELRRLKNLTFQTKSKTKVGGAGVTQAIVDAIHEKWKMSEIVRLKIEGAPALNMKRMHEILERKTGGLVIWRSGTAVSLYRGVSYEVPSVQLNRRIYKRNEMPASSLLKDTNKQIYRRNVVSTNSLTIATDRTVQEPSEFGPYDRVHTPRANLETTTRGQEDTGSVSEVRYEDEVDKLLDGLGPRYTDWPGLEPLPVDADMLPGIVPGYQPPFRILPYGVRSTLTRKEATNLQRLARVLPPHFALGRSRQLQGLAVAMIKLWEKSSIAKIALKRGVQLTTSERMAEDIKRLTGGGLLSRNKDFLVFYRGKDFLSSDVTEVLMERERLANSLQDEEEQARLRASAFVLPNAEVSKQSGTAGTLGETLDANARWGKSLDYNKENLMKEAEITRHASLVRKLERKLSQAERKLMKAERALSKVEFFLKPAERQADPHSITDEERFMFRKLGLRMKAFLLLGRRGVFDGTVENMHLHWKYRELVKIIVKVKTFDQVKKVALALEAESGGVLVSVDKISKGYAIVVFRGKDYQRPSILRPKNLLTKRKALARSIELQRHEALLNHVGALETRVDKLRSEIDQMNSVKDQGDEEFYDKLDSAYASEDEDTEDEGDEAYLETYNGGYESEDESENSIPNLHLETSFPYDDHHHQESETKPLDSEAEAEAYVEPNTNKSDVRIDDSENEDDSFY